VSVAHQASTAAHARAAGRARRVGVWRPLLAHMAALKGLAPADRQGRGPGGAQPRGRRAARPLRTPGAAQRACAPEAPVDRPGTGRVSARDPWQAEPLMWCRKGSPAGNARLRAPDVARGAPLLTSSPFCRPDVDGSPPRAISLTLDAQTG
jgi:hypothetical protein